MYSDEIRSIMAALGVCLGVNILTEYFFFKDEFRRKVVKE